MVREGAHVTIAARKQVTLDGKNDTLFSRPHHLDTLGHNVLVTSVLKFRTEYICLRKKGNGMLTDASLSPTINCVPSSACPLYQ